MVTQTDGRNDKTETKELTKPDGFLAVGGMKIRPRDLRDIYVRKYNPRVACVDGVVSAVYLAMKVAYEVKKNVEREYSSMVLVYPSSYRETKNEDTVTLPAELMLRFYSLVEEIEKMICKGRVILYEEAKKEALKWLVKHFENKARDYENEIREEILHIIDVLRGREIIWREYLISSRIAENLKGILRELYSIEMPEESHREEEKINIEELLRKCLKCVEAMYRS